MVSRGLRTFFCCWFSVVYSVNRSHVDFGNDKNPKTNNNRDAENSVALAATKHCTCHIFIVMIDRTWKHDQDRLGHLHLYSFVDYYYYYDCQHRVVLLGFSGVQFALAHRWLNRIGFICILIGLRWLDSHSMAVTMSHCFVWSAYLCCYCIAVDSWLAISYFFWTWLVTETDTPIDSHSQ